MQVEAAAVPRKTSQRQEWLEMVVQAEAVKAEMPMLILEKLELQTQEAVVVVVQTLPKAPAEVAEVV
jgi:hypothetical protein